MQSPHRPRKSGAGLNTLANQRLPAAVTVSDPRRSQLIEVIKYTVEHPIEYDSKTRDVFTLAHAVRAVWLKNHAAWEKVPGGYETFGALKGACYGLQKKDNDAFKYQ